MASTKLTDTQLVSLSAAARREDHAVELPPTVKGGALQKFVAKLTDLGLIEEVRARAGLPVWRRDRQNRAMALRITTRGLKAIGLGGEGPIDRAPASVEAKSIAGSTTARADTKSSGEKSVASKGSARSKQAQVITMLQRPEGATIAAVMAATGWQQHSVRGFFAGAIRKKLGLTLESEKINGDRIYRIVFPQPAKAGRKARPV
jgi:hypothetical protein